MAKRWQQQWPRGQMVDHPAVLAETRRHHGPGPAQLRHSDGLPIVVYERRRVWVDRDAWEMLPADGALLMRVRPTKEPAFDLVFTPQELENVFGEVRDTGSWDKLRYYHFPNNPRSIDSFLVSDSAGPRADSRPEPASPPPTATRRTSEPPTRRRPQPPTSTPGGSRLGWARAWFDRLGVQGESDEYLTAVEGWRDAWRPATVKALLVAESHVAQAPGDAGVRVRVPASANGARSLPSTYVRLVYCLGYGEDGICSPTPRTRNTGTKDFWDLFERIATTGPRHADEPLPRVALARKVAILERLADRGIWLEDASPVGIYKPGAGALTKDRNILNAIERQGYESHVWPGVADDAPGQVWAIGRTVARALHGLPGIRADRVVMQPSYATRAGVWDDYENELDVLCQALATAAP